MATKRSGTGKRSSKSKRPPWKKAAPKGTRRTRLSKAAKASARTAAKRSGRRYPNLVDNMRAASKAKRRKKRRAR